MKCIVKACPSDGIRPVSIAIPKGAELGRHEILAQEFRAEVKMCLRHHRMFVTSEKAWSFFQAHREELKA